MSNLIAIDFSANVITSLGEQVYICGNVSELGAWNPNNALRLHTNKDLYPEWKNKKPLMMHPNISLEFKLFVKGSHGHIRWQKIQQNRKFVPIESVLISFSESKIQMAFESTVFEEEETKIRKNTFDIIRDLSDEVSESSSGNEREFWMERRARDRGTISSSKQFVSDAKIIFDTWIPNRVRNSYRIVNSWTQILSSIHYIIKRQTDDDEPDLALQSEHLIPETSRNSTILFQRFKSDKNLDRFQFKKFPDDLLKIFHVEDDEENKKEGWAKNVIKTISKFEQGFFVIYLKNQRKPIDQYLLDKAQMIVIKNKQILKESLEKFHIRKNHSVSMVKQNQFLIKKENNQFVIVLFEPNLPALDEQFTKNHEYFSGVEKNLTNQKHFRLPENMKLSIMLQKNVIRDVHKNKFCLVILCEKIQQIPQKIVTKLIRVSSCPNVSINIMTGDEIPEIFKKLPVSENDKLLVYNRGGQVFKPSKKPANIYEEIHINYKKYQEVFKHLKGKAKFWVENKEVQIVESPYSLQFLCEKSAIGEVISESLANEFATYDDHRKYPYQIQKYVTEDKRNIVVHVRPLLSSTEFYSAIITSINISASENTYFFSFDYTRDRYKFVEKMERASNEKKAIHEGFVMADSQGKGGLATRKFDQFLSLLLNEAYYSIIESDLEETVKSANKREKDIIRSDFIN